MVLLDYPRLALSCHKVLRLVRMLSKVGSRPTQFVPFALREQTGKKRQDLSREYSDVIDRRRASSGDKDEGVSGTGGSGDGDAGGEGEEEEVRLREALRAANAEHFKSWLMIFKVREMPSECADPVGSWH